MLLPIPMKSASCLVGFLLFVSLAFAGRSQARVYTIKRGDHYSSPRVVRFFSSNRMDLQFVFDESAYYEFSGNAVSDQLDTNKLYGFSDCRSHHSENSARLGFRDNGGKIEILAFTHRDGRFYTQVLTEVQPHQVNKGSISLSDDRKRYIYEVNGARAEVERGCEESKATGYALQPYFGGNQVAPHDIRIRVDVAGELAPVYADFPYPTIINGGTFKMKVSAEEEASFFVRVYDSFGRKVLESPKQILEPGAEQILDFQVNEATGGFFLLVVPYAITREGVELRAALNPRVSGEAYRLLIPR